MECAMKQKAQYLQIALAKNSQYVLRWDHIHFSQIVFLKQTISGPDEDYKSY